MPGTGNIIHGLSSFFQVIRSGFLWQAVPGTSLHIASMKVTPGAYGDAAHHRAAGYLLQDFFRTQHFKDFGLYIERDPTEELNLHLSTSTHNLLDNEGERALQQKLIRAQEALTQQLITTQAYHHDDKEMIRFPELNNTAVADPVLGIVKYVLYDLTHKGLQVALHPHVHGAYPHQDHPQLIDKLGKLSPKNIIQDPNYFVQVHPLAHKPAANVVQQCVLRPSLAAPFPSSSGCSLILANRNKETEEQGSSVVLRN